MKMNRGRRVTVNVFLVLFSVCLGLLLAEMIVRSFVTLSPFQHISENGLHWNQSHETRKYSLTPGYKGRLVAQEYNTSVFINDLGIRSSPLPIPMPSTRRNDGEEVVFVIGDSFVFGIGVDYEDSIPARLESYVNSAGAVKREVWNLGTPGYAIQQYIFTVEEYLAEKTPSQVVLCLYIGKIPSGANDITGAVRFENSMASSLQQESSVGPNVTENDATTTTTEKFKEQYTLKRSPSREIKKWLERHSALYTFIMLRVGPSVRALKHRVAEVDDGGAKTFALGWQLLGKYLDRLDVLRQQYRFKVLVVYIPEHSDVLNGYTVLGAQLEQVALAYRYPFVNGYDVIKSKYGANIYYPLDGHLTATGYDLMARAIADSIR